MFSSCLWVFKYITMWECLWKDFPLVPYLPLVQIECMRRCASLLKEQEMKEQRKTGWAHVACKSMQAGTSPYFSMRQINQPPFSTLGRNTREAGAKCNAQWDGNTLDVHNPSWELCWNAKILNPNLHWRREGERRAVSKESRFSSMVTVHQTVQDVSLYFDAVHPGTGHL